MKIGKYVILASIMILLFITMSTCINIVERAGSQQVAYGAVQQFNENTNAYVDISVNTGIKNIFIFLSYLIGLLCELFCGRLLIRWIRKDIKEKK